MAQAKSTWSDEWFWVFDTTVNVQDLNNAQRRALESKLDDILYHRHDVVDCSVDFEGDKLMVYAETTEDIWDEVKYTLFSADVEWNDYDQHYLPEEEPDCEPTWYSA